MILAIETSCDDTSAALVSANGELYSSVVSSQHDVHKKYEGVVPELASRRHCEVITVIIREALEQAEMDWTDVDAVAATQGPGLIGSLLVGLAAGKALSLRFDLPLIPVHHIEAHAYSAELEYELKYPYVTLVASGGHTIIFLVRSSRDYEVLGQTRDDAAGEAYDKVAKMLELGYPGGPAIEKSAREGEPQAISFPRPTLTGSKRWNWRIEDFDFSFSGLKTAVYYYLNENPDATRADVAASFQRSVNDCLVHKTVEAARKYNVPRITLGGGVAANSALQESFRQRAENFDLEIFVPSLQFCTDNAAMIGYRAGQLNTTADLDLNANPNLSLNPL